MCEKYFKSAKKYPIPMLWSGMYTKIPGVQLGTR